MHRKTAIVTIPGPLRPIYEYLDGKYETALYRDAHLMTHGTPPGVTKVAAEPHRTITYVARGRDGLTGVPLGSWRWGYVLAEIAPDVTRVEIWYEYSTWFAILAGGTAAGQAANEITETVSALEALVRPRARDP